MLVWHADPWPLPGQASGRPSVKPPSHSETQPSVGKNVLGNRQPAELLSEVPIRDKVTKKYLRNLLGFGNLESPNYRGPEEPAPVFYGGGN